jgi:hypothetical protein
LFTSVSSADIKIIEEKKKRVGTIKNQNAHNTKTEITEDKRRKRRAK